MKVGDSKIEWTDKTWNPITGCTKISPGCQNCYAERMSKRLAGRCGYQADEPFRVTMHADRLQEPLRWRKPCKVFVCSMGDLFHKDVPTSYIAQVFRMMEYCTQHIFLVLTKRPERMKQLINGVVTGWETEHRKHIWLGVTAENQEQADKRIPILLSVPAAVRFLSIEPMLEPLTLAGFDGVNTYRPWLDKVAWGTPLINWVICGGESGPGARPMHPDWARSLRDECANAGVPFFLKQMSINGKMVKMPELDGKVWGETP